MSINRKDLEDGRIVFATVEGGDKDDPDPQKLGRVRARETGVHGPQVKTAHLKFIQHMVNSGAQHETPRPPRPGQLIQILKTTDGYGYISGIAMGMAAQVQGTFDKLVPQISEAIKKSTGMQIPPNVKDKSMATRGGLPGVTKEVVEKGEEDRHELYNGLPSHGASPSMAGLINNPVRQVSTALTELGGVLNSSILSSIPGQLFSAGNLLNLLSTDQMKELKAAVPADIMGALNNLMTLKQSAEGGSLPGNFMMGGIVNPETFIPKILEKLKGMKTFGELDNIIHGMAGDALSSDAQEGLKAITSTVTGVFGEFEKKIGLDGSIINTLSDTMQTLVSRFESILSGIPSAGSTLFGADSKIKELIKRLKSDSLIKNAKENLENKHPSNNTKRGTLTNGGNKGTTVGSQSYLA